jgi:hypothetical protein
VLTHVVTAVKEPVPVNLDIDREFADIKSTGPTSVHAAVLNNCKTFARLGKGLIEYILENFDALSKGDSKVQAMVNQSISTLKATAGISVWLAEVAYTS